MRILEVNPAGALCVLDLDDCHILAAACDMARGSTCAADRRAALGGLAAAFDVAVLLLDVEEENPADFPVEPTPPAAATLLGVMGALRAQADLLSALCEHPLGGRARPTGDAFDAPDDDPELWTLVDARDRALAAYQCGARPDKT